jgi:hypothetical protein
MGKWREDWCQRGGATVRARHVRAKSRFEANDTKTLHASYRASCVHAENTRNIISTLCRTHDHSNAKDQDERLHWYRAPRIGRKKTPSHLHAVQDHNSFLFRRRSCIMPAMGPEILTRGCPNFIMFSLGFSSSSPAPFLHRNQDPSRESRRGAGVEECIYRWKAILAVRQVILSPSSVYTSARTVYVPCSHISAASHIQRDGGMYRRDLPGDVDVLGERHLSLVERALEVRFANRVAAVGFLVNEGDEPVLDLQVHLEALLDLVLEGARGLDRELLSTTNVSFVRDTKAYSYAKRTASAGWGPGPPSRSSGCRPPGRRRSRAGCRQAPCTLP